MFYVQLTKSDTLRAQTMFIIARWCAGQERK